MTWSPRSRARRRARSAARSRTTSSRSTLRAATTSSRHAPRSGTVDAFAWCAEHAPRFNTISISGYHIREAGSTAVQEIAFTLAPASPTWRPRWRRAWTSHKFAPRLSFFFNAHNDVFQEVAKFRAARELSGTNDARSVRRAEPQVDGAALPCPDRRLDPDGAAAGERTVVRVALQAVQRRGRWCAVDPHQWLRRGTLASD